MTRAIIYCIYMNTMNLAHVDVIITAAAFAAYSFVHCG